MKGDKMIKSSTFGSRMRKRLSDITNLNSQHKSPFKNQENVGPAVVDCSTNICINKLLQENAVMVKLLEEKDKIIESNGVEMKKLRDNLQKTQLQNWCLAQSHNQMTVELKLAKDKLTNLQHELLCKNALCKAVTLELKEKAKMHCETSGLQEGETKVEGKTKSGETILEAVKEQPLMDNDIKTKVSKTKRGRPAKSQSMGPTMSQQAVDKEMVENKRRCLRRQSMRMKPPEKQDDLTEIEMEKRAVSQTTNFSHRKSNSNKAVDEGRSMQMKPPEKQDDSTEIKPEKNAVSQTTNFSRRKSSSDKADDEGSLSESSKSAGTQRPSIGRPQRRVTEKVHSYKDPPLNTKMRRPV